MTTVILINATGTFTVGGDCSGDITGRLALVDAWDAASSTLVYTPQTEDFIPGEVVRDLSSDGIGQIPFTAGSASGDGGAVSTATGVEPESLVLEDGTGLSTANTYVSLNEADLYVRSHLRQPSWTTVDPSVKKQSLRLATQFVDTIYATQFMGVRSKSTQALQWPRSFVFDDRGAAITGVPRAIKDATIEMATRYVDNPTIPLLRDIEASESQITAESFSVGPISSSTSYSGTKAAGIVKDVVSKILRAARLIESGGFARR